MSVALVCNTVDETVHNNAQSRVQGRLCKVDVPVHKCEGKV
jgi:hypothetical protein